MLPPLFLLLLLLLPSTGAYFDESTFHFSGFIVCQYNQTFTYRIHVLEMDTVTPNDEIYVSANITATSSPSLYNIVAVEDDDGPGDNFFEIEFLIFHDCAVRRVYTKAIVGQFKVERNGNHVHRADFDITNKGIPY